MNRHGCADQIPIVDDEMKKAAGDEKDEDIQMTQGIVQKLVTADGTYASQSAFSALLPVKKDQARWSLFMFLFSLSLLAENLNILNEFSKKLTGNIILICGDDAIENWTVQKMI